jgi:hypothetical protein
VRRLDVDGFAGAGQFMRRYACDLLRGEDGWDLLHLAVESGSQIAKLGEG